VTMNVLFVYVATTFDIESQIEFLGAGNAIEVIEPGKRVLAPGVYRFADGVGITRVSAINGSAGEVQMLAVPNGKDDWPDPPLANKVASALGVSLPDLVHFLGGSGVQTELG